MVQNGKTTLPLAGLAAFEVVARHLKFARAAAELGITPTAMSKAIAQLEHELGVRLFQRTTRSVALTDAGERLARAVTPALAQLRHGIDDARTSMRGASGLLRIDASFVAYATFVAPHLTAFLAAYPNIQLEVSMNDAPRDIVARGFDAGIRPGRALSRDMISVPLGHGERLIVVGSSRYFAAHGRPRSIDDLTSHSCIRQRLGGDGRMLEWTLRRGRKLVTIEVSGRLVVDEMRSALAAAIDGHGLAYVFERFAGEALRSGAVQPLLLSSALPREPFHLYYPSRRQMADKMRVFVDLLRAAHR